MSCEVKWDAFGVRCIYSDFCTNTDCREALTQIKRRYCDLVPTYVMHDFTDARGVEQGIAELVALDAPKLGPDRKDSERHSAVVSPDGAVCALVKRNSAQTSRRVLAFKSRAEAEDWLLTLFR